MLESKCGGGGQFSSVAVFPNGIQSDAATDADADAPACSSVGAEP